MDDTIIIKKLSDLIKDGNLARDYEQDRKRFQISAKNIIRIRFGEDSTYYNDFINTYKSNPIISETYYEYQRRLTASQVGVLEAILDALKNGLTDDLFYQRELLVYSDLLEQAFEFLENGLELASGIYGRVVLETTIKEFAKGHDIDSKLKFDQIIINLRIKGLIQKPFENSLRAIVKFSNTRKLEP